MPITAPIPQRDDISTILWTGQSGNAYSFQIHPIGTVYLDRPGVYIFCTLAPNGNWNATYIGETDSFLRRLSTNLQLHHKWQRIVASGSTHICTLHVPAGGLALREGIETDLRRQIPTPCNDQ